MDMAYDRLVWSLVIAASLVLIIIVLNTFNSTRDKVKKVALLLVGIFRR